MGWGDALIGFVGGGRSTVSEVGRERVKNGRQSRHVRQPVAQSAELAA